MRDRLERAEGVQKALWRFSGQYRFGAQYVDKGLFSQAKYGGARLLGADQLARSNVHLQLLEVFNMALSGGVENVPASREELPAERVGTEWCVTIKPNADG